MAKKTKKARNLVMADFYDLIADSAPEKMSPEEVARLVTTIVLSYADDEREAGAMIMLMARIVRDYYTMKNDGECTCDKCAAKRKAEAH
jgi:hypothetical protein